MKDIRGRIELLTGVIPTPHVDVVSLKTSSLKDRQNYPPSQLC
jgi:hypothetical protein